MEASLLIPPVLTLFHDMPNPKYDFGKTALTDQGYFKMVGSIDPADLPSVKKAVFTDSSGFLYNATGDAVDYSELSPADAYQYLGYNGPLREKELEELLCHALNLPLDRTQLNSSTPIWYIDEYIAKRDQLIKEQQYKDNTAMERWFRKYIAALVFGFTESASDRYRRNGKAVGGIRFILTKLEFRQYGSSVMYFKIAGFKAFQQCFCRDKT